MSEEYYISVGERLIDLLFLNLNNPEQYDTLTQELQGVWLAWKRCG